MSLTCRKERLSILTSFVFALLTRLKHENKSSAISIFHFYSLFRCFFRASGSDGNGNAFSLLLLKGIQVRKEAVSYFANAVYAILNP